MSNKLDRWNKEFNTLMEQGMELQLHPVEVLYILRRAVNDVEYALFSAIYSSEEKLQ